MADPTKYTPSYDFSDFQASAPTTPLPADELDGELFNIETAIEGLVNAVKDVRRSDGALKNGIVTTNSLDATLQASVGDLTGAIADAEASATAAAASASAASTSASSASTTASSASTSATAATNAKTAAETAQGLAEDAQAAAEAALASVETSVPDTTFALSGSWSSRSNKQRWKDYITTEEFLTLGVPASGQETTVANANRAALHNAIQTMLAEGKSKLIFSPKAHYLSSGGVVVPDGFKFEAQHSYRSVVHCMSATGDLFQVGAAFEVGDLKIVSQVTRTNGRYFYVTGNGFRSHSVKHLNYYLAIEFAEDVRDWLIEDWIFQDGTAKNVAAGGGAISVNGGSSSRLGSGTASTQAIGENQPDFFMRVLGHDTLAIAEKANITQHGTALLVTPSVKGVYNLTSNGALYDWNGHGNGVLIAPTGTGVVERTKFIGDWFGTNYASGIKIDPTSGGVVNDLEIFAPMGHTNGKVAISGQAPADWVSSGVGGRAVEVLGGSNISLVAPVCAGNANAPIYFNNTGGFIECAGRYGAVAGYGDNGGSVDIEIGGSADNFSLAPALSSKGITTFTPSATKRMYEPIGINTIKHHATHQFANISVTSVTSGQWAGTAVGVSYGGTGATSAFGARGNLGFAASTTENALARFDGAEGATQNSKVIVDDSGNVSIENGAGDLSVFFKKDGSNYFQQYWDGTNRDAHFITQDASDANGRFIFKPDGIQTLLLARTYGWFYVPMHVASYTVATLPAGMEAGAMAYASDCRVFNGAGTQEGVGAGTGGLVTYNGSAWKIAGTNITAVA